jgi:hypothetical protein
MAQSLSTSSMIWSGSSPVPDMIALKLTQSISSEFSRTKSRMGTATKFQLSSDNCDPSSARLVICCDHPVDFGRCARQGLRQ